MVRGIKRVKELVEKEQTAHTKYQARENKKLLMLASGYSGFGTASNIKRDIKATRGGHPDKFFSGGDTQTVWSGGSGLASGGGPGLVTNAKADTKRV